MAGTITFELDRFNSVCTMGMLIGSEFSGQGIGSKAWGLGMDFAFSNLMARKVKAGTADENYAMQEIFKKNNMKYEATLYSDLLIEGKQQDLLIYTKFKISTQVITSGDDA
jgi:RimJ/RimL family protein N-acetyltransferase